MPATDGELIEASKSGNVSAFQELMYRYDRDVLTIASRFTTNADDAKDIYQETFIRVFKGLPAFRSDSKFSTWIFRIATNVCLTFHQKKKRSASVSLNDVDDDGSIPVTAGEFQSDTLVRQNELSARIDRALGELSPQQRLVFSMRHFQEYKIREIAEMIGCAEGTVKNYLFEAIRKMRASLHDVYE